MFYSILLNIDLLDIIGSLIVPTIVSLSFVVLWIGFFYVYSPKKTIHVKYLSIAFFIGIGAAFLSLALERSVATYLNIDTSFLDPSFSAKSISDLYLPILFSFFFAAIIEESSKFVLIKQYFDITNVNQVIDGMKICLVSGLGFAFIENILYFYNINTLTLSEIIALFVLRGMFSTLAHAIYGIVMGYYLALGKFYDKLRSNFIWRALIASILIHGLFNFFLIIKLGFYSLFMLASLLIAVVLWYNDRKNLELHIMSGDQTIVVPPFLAEKLELEVWKSKHSSSSDYLEKLWNILLETDDRKSEPRVK